MKDEEYEIPVFATDFKHNMQHFPHEKVLQTGVDTTIQNVALLSKETLYFRLGRDGFPKGAKYNVLKSIDFEPKILGEEEPNNFDIRRSFLPNFSRNRRIGALIVQDGSRLPQIESALNIDGISLLYTKKEI